MSKLKRCGLRDDDEKIKPVISKKEVIFNDLEPVAEGNDYHTQPYIINIDYNNDVNLISIHDAIRDKFVELMCSIDIMKNKMEKLKRNMENFKFTKSEASQNLQKIKDLESDINSLETGSLWNNYITSVRDIILKYIPLMSDESKKMIVYSGKKNDIFDEHNFTREQIKERLTLISDYISNVKILIPEKYIKINCVWNGRLESYCSCGELYQNFCVDDEKGINYCKCGIERSLYFNNATLDTITSINTYTRSDYESLKTFKTAWLEHQGRCANSIPEEIFLVADEYFKLHKKPTREYYKNIKCENTGRKPGTSIELIIEFLKSKRYIQYYSLYNVFGRDYFGWTLPDYTNIDDQIYESYQLTQAVYETMDKDRKFNINNEARQCLLLLSHDVPVSFYDDFKSLSRSAIIRIQTDWYDMCRGTNFRVKYVPIIN